MGNTYLDWVIENTATQWWHDSADDGGTRSRPRARRIGVTTNPVLAYAAVQRNRERWHEAISTPVGHAARAEGRSVDAHRRDERESEADATLRGGPRTGGFRVRAGQSHARGRSRVHVRHGGALAVLGARTSPSNCRRPPQGWMCSRSAPLKASTTTATVSFTVPQALAIAERHRPAPPAPSRGAFHPGNVSLSS